MFGTRVDEATRAFFGLAQAIECEHIVKVSYIGIYNEKVRDLLNLAATSRSRGACDQNAHPSLV